MMINISTRSSVIFIGPGLLGFLDRDLCVYNVFGYMDEIYVVEQAYSDVSANLLLGKKGLSIFTNVL